MMTLNHKNINIIIKYFTIMYFDFCQVEASNLNRVGLVDIHTWNLNIETAHGFPSS